MTDAKKQKINKIIGIVVNTLIWLFVAFSVIITVIVFAAQNSDDGIPEIFGTSFITIETPSMSPTYEVGDLVFLKKLDDAEKRELKVGDIITYTAPIDINGDGNIGDLNTHRIHEIKDGRIISKGDKALLPDSYTIGYSDVIGVCNEGSWGGIGNVIRFLRTSIGFFFCILLPLILFFLYELYNFISVLVTERVKKEPVSKETEEEIKRRAIEEYLQQQKEAEKTQELSEDQK